MNPLASAGNDQKSVRTTAFAAFALVGGDSCRVGWRRSQGPPRRENAAAHRRILADATGRGLKPHVRQGGAAADLTSAEAGNDAADSATAVASASQQAAARGDFDDDRLPNLEAKNIASPRNTPSDARRGRHQLGVM